MKVGKQKIQKNTSPKKSLSMEKVNNLSKSKTLDFNRQILITWSNFKHFLGLVFLLKTCSLWLQGL